MMQTHLYDINKSHLCEVGFFKYKNFLPKTAEF